MLCLSVHECVFCQCEQALLQDVITEIVVSQRKEEEFQARILQRADVDSRHGFARLCFEHDLRNCYHRWTPALSEAAPEVTSSNVCVRGTFWFRDKDYVTTIREKLRVLCAMKEGLRFESIKRLSFCMCVDLPSIIAGISPLGGIHVE